MINESTSLSPASARITRAAAIAAAQPNLVKKAQTQGFYDAMLGLPDRRADYSKMLVVAYEQGISRALSARELLKGQPWTERVIERDGASWTWALYREGLYVAGGTARKEKEADDSAMGAWMDMEP
jgi:hypothetical protein